MTPRNPTRSGKNIEWRIAPAVRPDRPPTIELSVIAALIGWNVAVNVLESGAWTIAVNIMGAAVLVAAARRGGATWRQLGMATADFRTGTRVGAVAAAGVVLAVAALSLIPYIQTYLMDDRFLGVAAPDMLAEVLLRIPLVTVATEEIAFRGVLLGLLLLWSSPIRANLMTSVLFGLWHLLPALATLDSNPVGEGAGLAVSVLAVLGQVVATALASFGFGWLRLRSGHVSAPMLAHWGLNASAYVVGWLLVR